MGGWNESDDEGNRLEFETTAEYERQLGLSRSGFPLPSPQKDDVNAHSAAAAAGDPPLFFNMYFVQ